MVHPPKRRTECDRCGCIILFTSPDCFFCPTARQILIDILNEFNISECVLCEIDPHNDEESIAPTIAVLPTIRICAMDIVGVPNDQDLKDAILQAISNHCFQVD